MMIETGMSPQMGRPAPPLQALGRFGLDTPPPLLDWRAAADLARVIEGEIIPRLMLAHATPTLQQDPVGDAALQAFTRLTLASGGDGVTAHVEALVRGGMPLDRVYMDLLAPAARRLGDDWNEDLISFADVTMGLSRLQQTVRSLAASLPAQGGGAGAKSACFVAAPGEQHSFGLFLVEDRFRRAGWRTWLDSATTVRDAAAAAAGDWFDVFGLSATSDASLDAIAATVAAVRRRSINRRIFVMVGGRLFIEEPALTQVVGADAATDTAAEALSVADKAVHRPAFA